MTPSNTVTQLLRFDDVSFSYRKRGKDLPVLHGVNFGIRAEERLAIVGPSGGGKSTLLQIASGISQASSGAVTFDGHDLSALREEARAQIRLEHMAVIYQDFRLLDNLTAAQNVAIPLRLRGERVGSALKKAEHALAKLGLSSRCGHYPKELSGGEQQRVAIARALVGEPQLILADEPTGSLDTQLRDEAVSLLMSSCTGKAMIVVTHDPTVATAIGDRVLKLQNGNLQPV